jgi:hypothetical protein
MILQLFLRMLDWRFRLIRIPSIKGSTIFKVIIGSLSNSSHEYASTNQLGFSCRCDFSSSFCFKTILGPVALLASSSLEEHGLPNCGSAVVGLLFDDFDDDVFFGFGIVAPELLTAGLGVVCFRAFFNLFVTSFRPVKFEFLKSTFQSASSSEDFSFSFERSRAQIFDFEIKQKITEYIKSNNNKKAATHGYLETPKGMIFLFYKILL